jgi:hypothetical protein
MKKIHNLLTYVSLVFIKFQLIYNPRVASVIVENKGCICELMMLSMDSRKISALYTFDTGIVNQLKLDKN